VLPAGGAATGFGGMAAPVGGAHPVPWLLMIVGGSLLRWRGFAGQRRSRKVYVELIGEEAAEAAAFHCGARGRIAGRGRRVAGLTYSSATPGHWPARGGEAIVRASTETVVRTGANQTAQARAACPEPRRPHFPLS